MELAKKMVESWIKESNQYYFYITTNGDQHYKIRLFISNHGSICRFAGKSRKKGWEISEFEISDWKEIIPDTQKSNYMMIFKRNLNRVIGCLSTSGLWQHFLEDFKELQMKSDALVAELFHSNYSETQRLLKESGIQHISPSILGSLFDRRCIRTINFGRWNGEIRNNYLQSLKEKRRYHHRWRLGYDNTLEYDPVRKLAWYSEEYKDCGNGHYYIALDSTHCGFREDD